MVVTFDTTGFQRVGEATWQNPTSGDSVNLKMDSMPLTEPAWLEDIPAMRRKLTFDYGKIGCLIEAEPVVVGGVRGVCQVAKAPLPNAPTGQVFIGTIFLAKANCCARLSYLADEGGITGARETAVMVKLGVRGPDGWVLPHPYAPEAQSVLPFHRGDDPAWDALFPTHPLSRLRAWVGSVLATGRVDATFAALPDFVPSWQAPATEAGR